MFMPQCDFVVVLLINFQSAKFKSLMHVKVGLLEQRKSAGPPVPKALSRTLCEASTTFPVQGKPVVTPATPHWQLKAGQGHLDVCPSFTSKMSKSYLAPLSLLSQSYTFLLLLLFLLLPHFFYISPHIIFPTLLSYISHTLKLSCLKGTVLWFLIESQTCVAITTI